MWLKEIAKTTSPIPSLGKRAYTDKHVPLESTY
jgi:hypothetical protein